MGQIHDDVLQVGRLEEVRSYHALIDVDFSHLCGWDIWEYIYDTAKMDYQLVHIRYKYNLKAHLNYMYMHEQVQHKRNAEMKISPWYNL